MSRHCLLCSAFPVAAVCLTASYGCVVVLTFPKEAMAASTKRDFLSVWDAILTGIPSVYVLLPASPVDRCGVGISAHHNTRFTPLVNACGVTSDCGEPLPGATRCTCVLCGQCALSFSRPSLNSSGSQYPLCFLPFNTHTHIRTRTPQLHA
jgi:hypothetical protein